MFIVRMQNYGTINSEIQGTWSLLRVEALSGEGLIASRGDTAEPCHSPLRCAEAGRSVSAVTCCGRQSP